MDDCAGCALSATRLRNLITGWHQKIGEGRRTGAATGLENTTSCAATDQHAMRCWARRFGNFAPCFTATLRQHFAPPRAWKIAGEKPLNSLSGNITATFGAKTKQNRAKWKRGYPYLSVIYGAIAEASTVFKTAGFNRSPIPPNDYTLLVRRQRRLFVDVSTVGWSLRTRSELDGTEDFRPEGRSSPESC